MRREEEGGRERGREGGRETLGRGDKPAQKTGLLPRVWPTPPTRPQRIVLLSPEHAESCCAKSCCGSPTLNAHGAARTSRERMHQPHTPIPTSTCNPRMWRCRSSWVARSRSESTSQFAALALNKPSSSSSSSSSSSCPAVVHSSSARPAPPRRPCPKSLLPGCLPAFPSP
jgi:hypothetical protein